MNFLFRCLHVFIIFRWEELDADYFTQIQPLEPYRLKKADAKELRKHVPRFNDLNSVMLALQDSTLTMWQVRKLFDLVMAKYTAMDKYLGTKAEIIHSPNFEDALVKLESGAILSPEDEVVLQPLLVCFLF